MALYLGDSKRKVCLNGKIYFLNFYTGTPITNGIKLLSSDEYILKDLNLLYLTTKEGE